MLSSIPELCTGLLGHVYLVVGLGAESVTEAPASPDRGPRILRVVLLLLLLLLGLLECTLRLPGLAVTGLPWLQQN